MDWGVKRGSPSYGLGERYTNSARRLGMVRTSCLKGCLLHRLSQRFIGRTEQASSERAGDKREGRGGGVGGYGRIAGHFTPHSLGGHFVTELPWCWSAVNTKARTLVTRLKI